MPQNSVSHLLFSSSSKPFVVSLRMANSLMLLYMLFRLPQTLSSTLSYFSLKCESVHGFNQQALMNLVNTVCGTLEKLILNTN